MRARAAASLFLLLAPLAAAALPVPVSVEGAGPPRDARVRAVPVSRADRAAAEPVETTVQVPGAVELDLAAGIVWELSAVSPGAWAAPQVVLVEPAARPVRLRLLPTGTVEGRFSVARGVAPPRHLEARVQTPPRPPQTAAAPAAIPEARIPCAVEGDRFRCELPAGLLDLRLGAEGFVPHYLWGVRIEAGAATRLAELALAAGASVSGRVTTADDGGGPEPATVLLAPRAAGRQERFGEAERLAARSLTVSVGDRGFFQLSGVPPGSYVLSADKPGFATARVAPVDVFPESESRLPDAIVLERPATLELALAPPADPFGRPWRVELYQVDELSGALEEAGSGAAGADGRWLRQGLAPGPYRLFIESGEGSRWVDRELRVAPGLPPVEVDVPVVRVEGTIERGREPLAATLWFGGLHGREKIRFESDEDGRFEGHLPREGHWPLDLQDPATGDVQTLEPVEVERPPGKSSAELAITVPDTLLHGQVVDDADRPVGGASLTLASEARRRREAVARADGEGRFRLRGLSPGRVIVEATSEDASSGWVSVALEEGVEPAPLRLVVRRQRRVAGTIVSPAGAVPGALVLARPGDGSTVASVAQAVTGADGGFDLVLPAAAGGFDLVVFPPGFALAMRRVAAPPEEPLRLDVAPHGGTLVLEVPPGEGGSPFTRGVELAHGGAALGVYHLLEWARHHRAGESEPGRLVLPMMEAGDYTMCMATQEGTASRCASGALPPHGELTLRIETGEPGSGEPIRSSVP